MMHQFGYWDIEGQPIKDVVEFARLFENKAYQRLAHAQLANGFQISTVWLGIDHNFGRHKRPVIFETMIFDKFNGRWDRNIIRYCEKGFALRGHRRVIEACRRRRPIWLAWLLAIKTGLDDFRRKFVPEDES